MKRYYQLVTISDDQPLLAIIRKPSIIWMTMHWSLVHMGMARDAGVGGTTGYEQDLATQIPIASPTVFPALVSRLVPMSQSVALLTTIKNWKDFHPSPND